MLSTICVASFAAYAGLFCAAHAADFQTLYSFCGDSSCTDGKMPFGLTMDSSGSFYGATYYGGDNGGGGVVFTFRSDGGTLSYKKIYSFCGTPGCTDPGFPLAAPIVDANG